MLVSLNSRQKIASKAHGSSGSGNYQDPFVKVPEIAHRNSFATGGGQRNPAVIHVSVKVDETIDENSSSGKSDVADIEMAGVGHDVRRRAAEPAW
ncbi:hypothetical protein RQP46_000413 [Phenoliferia psychrophenolica]